MYKVVFTKEASKNFRRLDKRLQRLAAKAIDRLSKNPKVGTPLSRKLKGLWKIRFSRYRIIYRILEQKLIVIIFDVGHRKEIYKKTIR